MKTKYSEHSLKSFGSIVKIAISVVFFVTVYFLTAKSALYQDFQVYYSAGSSVNPFISYDYSLYDQDLTVGTVRTYGLVEYVFSHSGLHLPFTYPPFAALLFLPISAFPYSIAAFIHACVYGACAIAVAYLAACMLSKHEWFTRRINIMTPWWVMMIAAIFVVTSAWRGGTNYGQINPIIFLLVLWDFVRPAHRIPRGFFVGIAAGIKLTPLALMLVFLARREWTSILTTTLTFIGTVVLGFILLPSQSVQFWTSAIQDTSRVGRVRELGNISFQGIISTVVPEGVLLKALYILAAVAFIVLIYVFIRLSDKMYDAYVSNYITACAALLVSAFISPISWSHHSVYIPLIIICFIVFGFSLVQKTFGKLGGGIAISLILLAGFTLLFTPIEMSKFISRVWIRLKMFPFTDILRNSSTLDESFKIAVESTPVMFVTYIPYIAMVLIYCVWVLALARRNKDKKGQSGNLTSRSSHLGNDKLAKDSMGV